MDSKTSTKANTKDIITNKKSKFNPTKFNPTKLNPTKLNTKIKLKEKPIYNKKKSNKIPIFEDTMWWGGGFDE